jgi:hypothetical protein
MLTTSIVAIPYNYTTYYFARSHVGGNAAVVTPVRSYVPSLVGIVQQ